MAVVAEWFPEKKGFAVGLTLLGFGLSPFITAPLANKFIENFGVFSAFKILGLSFILILTALSMTLNFPVQNTNNQNFSTDSQSEFLPSQMLKTRTFYSLWFCFAIGTFSGLMVIGLSGVYAQEIINMTPSKAAIFTSLFALFNGIGRPLFGAITDKLGTKKAVYISYFLIISASILSILFSGNTFIFFISFSIMWLNLGGWLAIAPTSASNIFGKENYPSNFGIVFTAYGIGALCQGFVSGYIKETFNSYVYIFYPIILLCIIGLVVNTFILREKVKNTAIA
jgi:MFS family permease